MRKGTILSILMLFALIFTQCSRSTGFIDGVIPIRPKINFENMAVGQISLYVPVRVENIWSEKPIYKQLTDTIIVSIVSKDSIGFKIEEKDIVQGTKIYYYYKVVGDSLYVLPLPSMSYLPSILHSGASATYTLKDNNLPKYTVNEWGTPKTNNFLETYFGKISSVKLMGKVYENPFLYFSNIQNTVDGPTLTGIYSKSDGFISLQSLGAFRNIYSRIYYLIP